ncbi:MAG: hypothetical protein JNN27_15875 [Planctomycetes bacterium]|nr:hypothetical protein [Planctomycetota bacterium]
MNHRLAFARIRTLGLAVLASTFASCATYYEARFEPSPLEVKIEDTRVPGLLARGLASVRGIRKPTSEAPTPQFEVVLRIENVGQRPFTVDAGSFELVTANLKAFEGRAEGGSDAPVEPGGVQQLTVLFPFPQDMRLRDADVSGLALRWELRSDAASVVASASFEQRLFRNEPYFYGPVWWSGPRNVWLGNPRIGAFCVY